MKRKVSIFDKKLFSNYGFWIGLIGSLASIVALCVSLPGLYKLFSIPFFIVPIIVMVILYYNANHLKTKTLRINRTNIEILVGDLFSADNDKNLIVIQTNEYFDSLVDDIIISHSSIHGQYIDYHSTKKEFDLNVNKINKSEILGTNLTRKTEKKNIYRLGSYFISGNYYVTAFSHFDDNNRAFINYSDYIHFLFNLWDQLDVIYASKTVNMSILGSGITRFNGKTPSVQMLLETILWSLTWGILQENIFVFTFPKMIITNLTYII